MTLNRTYKDGNLQIFQNETKTIVLKHYAVRRGGSLWAGQINILNRETNQSVEFDTTGAPYNPEGQYILNNDEATLRYYEALVRKHTAQ